MMRGCVQIEVDRTTDAAYLRLSTEPVASTEEFTEDILIDLDQFRVVVGIEVLTLSARIPFRDLVSRYHVHSDVVAVLERVQPSVAHFVFTSGAESSTPREPSPLKVAAA